MRIGFGLALDFWSTDRSLRLLLDQYAEVLELATALGFDSVWAGEDRRVKPQPGHVPSPFLVLAALAGRTNLVVGTGVTLLPLWHPLRLAYDAVMLDHITGGRFVLGVGMGSSEAMRRYGVDPRDASVRADETLSALHHLWTGAEGFHGSKVQVEGGITPAPLQPGGPPIWVGGGVQRSVRRAADYGAAWYGSTPHSLSLIARQAGLYRRLLAERNRDPTHARVAINRVTFLAGTDDKALEQGAPYLDSILDFYSRLGLIRSSASEAAGPIGDDVVFVGSPETCAASIRKYVDAGVNHFNFRVSMANMPKDLVLRTINLLGKEVLPRFRPQDPVEVGPESQCGRLPS